MSDGEGGCFLVLWFLVLIVMTFFFGKEVGRNAAHLDEAKRWCAQNPNYKPAFKVNGEQARCAEGRLYFMEAGDA